MRILVIIILGMSLSGCSYLLCAYGFSCDAYYIEQLDQMEPKWNKWLGKTKDERMKAAGPPNNCAPLADGGEVCDWSSGGVSGGGSSSYNPYSGMGGGSYSVSSWEHHTIFTYDRDHIARSWSYHGSKGQRSSRDTKPTASDSRSEVEGK